MKNYFGVCHRKSDLAPNVKAGAESWKRLEQKYFFF
jgi:hypothetical protein